MAKCQVVIKDTVNEGVVKATSNEVVFVKPYEKTSDYLTPKVMLQWSDDGGHTWSNEYWKSAGRIGDYLARVIFNRLGMSRDRVFRITMTDPVKWVITGARMDAESEK